MRISMHGLRFQAIVVLLLCCRVFPGGSGPEPGNDEDPVGVARAGECGRKGARIDAGDLRRRS